MCRPPLSLLGGAAGVAGHSQTEQQKVNAKPRQEMPADDLQDSLIAAPQIQFPAPLVLGSKRIFGGLLDSNLILFWSEKAVLPVACKLSTSRSGQFPRGG